MKMRDGFSLIELSIVLVILGLLVGGILAGQSLIHASELRAITAEADRYKTAVQAFRDKYFALPGDMANAGSFWGLRSPCNYTNPATGQQTCNGDGDGQVTNLATESFTFWHHLANAGLIDGQYSGVAASTTPYAMNTANSPHSKFPGAYWYATFWGYKTGQTSITRGTYGHILSLSGGSSSGEASIPILSPADMWNIDTKIDDGAPGEGKFVTRYWDDCTDAATSSITSGQYLLSLTGILCDPIFRQVF
jgi:prepilin-type N-terminal cleavage/methylation domain-containing protein